MPEQKDFFGVGRCADEDT